MIRRAAGRRRRRRRGGPRASAKCPGAGDGRKSCSCRAGAGLWATGFGDPADAETRMLAADRAGTGDRARFPHSARGHLPAGRRRRSRRLRDAARAGRRAAEHRRQGRPEAPANEMPASTKLYKSKLYSYTNQSSDSCPPPPLPAAPVPCRVPAWAPFPPPTGRMASHHGDTARGRADRLPVDGPSWRGSRSSGAGPTFGLGTAVTPMRPIDSAVSFLSQGVSDACRLVGGGAPADEPRRGPLACIPRTVRSSVSLEFPGPSRYRQASRYEGDVQLCRFIPRAHCIHERFLCSTKLGQQ